MNKEIKQRVEQRSSLINVLIPALRYLLACEEVGEEVQESTGPPQWKKTKSEDEQQ